MACIKRGVIDVVIAMNNHAKKMSSFAGLLDMILPLRLPGVELN